MPRTRVKKHIRRIKRYGPDKLVRVKQHGRKVKLRHNVPDYKFKLPGRGRSEWAEVAKELNMDQSIFRRGFKESVIIPKKVAKQEREIKGLTKKIIKMGGEDELIRKGYLPDPALKQDFIKQFGSKLEDKVPYRPLETVKISEDDPLARKVRLGGRVKRHKRKAKRRSRDSWEMFSKLRPTSTHPDLDRKKRKRTEDIFAELGIDRV